jgi:hypothetical protein
MASCSSVTRFRFFRSSSDEEEEELCLSLLLEEEEVLASETLGSFRFDGLMRVGDK